MMEAVKTRMRKMRHDEHGALLPTAMTRPFRKVAFLSRSVRVGPRGVSFRGKG